MLMNPGYKFVEMVNTRNDHSVLFALCNTRYNDNYSSVLY